MKAARFVTLDAFAERQFASVAGGAASAAAAPIPMDKEAFTARVNAEIGKLGGLDACLRPGYAPFCKHVFVTNFTDARVIDLAITPANVGLLRSSYEARRPEELPVLQRFFPAASLGADADAGAVPVASHLDVILYSREQIRKENDAMPADDRRSETADEAAAAYGIISIKPQMGAVETPMQPATVLRNSLGKEHGGSGVPLDRAAYLASVAYWTDHAVIK